MANEEVKLNIEQLLTMALQGLDHLFFKVHKEKAKKLYKEISDGRSVAFGSLNFENEKLPPLKLKLALDQSEFVGHLTFHLFKTALQQTLRQLARKLEKKQDLNILNAAESQEVVIFTPGIIQHDDKINVMVVGIAPAHQSATIKLQFLDPEQFKKNDGVDQTEGEAKPAAAENDPDQQ